MYFNKRKSGYSKYNVDTSQKGKEKRTSEDGILFDSLLELKFYKEVVVPKLACGEIVEVKRQVQYELLPPFEYQKKKIRAIKYISDFDLTFSDGSFQVIDVKGMVKSTDLIKVKLFKYRNPTIDFKLMLYKKSIGWYQK